MKPFNNWQEAADHIISYHTFEFPIDLIRLTNSIHIPIEYRDFNDNLNVTNYVQDDRMVFVVPRINHQLSQAENYYYRVSYAENLYEFVLGDDNEGIRWKFVKELLMPRQYIVGHVIAYVNPSSMEILSTICKFWKWFNHKPSLTQRLQRKLNLPYSVVSDRITELRPYWERELNRLGL